MRDAKHVSEASRPLASFVAVDPESLPMGTSPNYTFRYIDIASATQGRLLLPDDEMEYRDAPSRARRVLRDQDVIMSTVRPNLKAFAYCRLPPGNFVASTGFAVLRSKEGTDPRFILYSILSDDVTRQIERFVVGSNYPAINSSDVKRLLVRNLSSTDQERVGEVIGTVDEAIEQTEALIAKTQQIKAGLMHDLFTRGVTPDGKLRPPHDEAPQLYKESPLGWIPKEWDCDVLDDLLARIDCPMRSGPFGSALLKEELIEDGIPLLGIDNVFSERFVTEYRRFVTPHKFVELSRYSVLPRDVIITIMGTVGRCCVVPDDIGEALSSKHLWTMTFDRNRVLPELICWQLNYAPWVKAWFARQSQGAVMDAIQSSTLRTLRLPVPPPDEQLLIQDRYLAGDEVLSVEQKRLDKLHHFKRGLMHDLLTGRVRIPDVATAKSKEVATNA